MAQIVFQTDQSGANQNICSTAVASTVTFNFSLSANYDAYSANITMKKASGTVDSVKVTIYNQPNGGGTAVGSSTVLAANVTQSFAPIEFLFSSLSLAAGTSYSLVISSTTSCSGSSPYSFKSGNFQVVDKTTSAVINTGYAIVSSMSSVATLGSSPKASVRVSASPSSLTKISATAIKSRSVSMSSYVVSALGAVAKMARSAVASLQARTVSAVAASVDKESSSELKSISTLSAVARLDSEASSAITSRASLSASAELTRGIECRHESNCSMSASAEINRGAEASIGASLSLEAGLSGAKSLFSVFAKLDVSSTAEAKAAVNHVASMEPAGCDSALAAGVALLADAMSRMDSSFSLSAVARVVGEGGGKKREGSGHYVLNTGAFTLRQWRRFTKASDDHVPQRRDTGDRRIDLRAPGLLRR